MAGRSGSGPLCSGSAGVGGRASVNTGVWPSGRTACPAGAGLSWAKLGSAGLGMAGLGSAGLGWAGLGWILDLRVRVPNVRRTFSGRNYFEQDRKPSPFVPVALAAECVVRFEGVLCQTHALSLRPPFTMWTIVLWSVTLPWSTLVHWSWKVV